ncbi:hypothetical protein ACFQY4_15620 [Catellatospora bangladeshensis]|uniref:Uncharacterized protein n=1 Tax=Catellatospora bangladeshensis TaxID=310355 RepID=A0A8J3NLV3_9ACTN|nr:hypothetical protein [Catellatospora bangladeshensis]GIF82970.1 hypothetical protein Cba03nite_43190 [Catellatospora bangladeshensis]
MNTNDYPVIMAVEDYVPVLLALAGFWLLGGASQRIDPVAALLGRAGAVLIGLGGVAKSTWKLVLSSTGTDWPWLEQSLFPLMATGALLVLWSLTTTLRGKVTPWWPYALVWVAVAGAAIGTGSLQPAFIAATAGVTLISVLGAVLAGRRRAWLAVVLFVLGIVGVTAMVPLRNHPDHHTVAFQWIEQGTNTVAQTLFLIAALLTVRAATRAPSPEPVGVPA